MRLLESSIYNFGLIAKAEVTWPEVGLVGIRGRNLDNPLSSSNGSGKSTLVNSIDWCLYGHSPDGATLKDVVGPLGGQARVGTTFVGVDGAKYCVERTAGQSSSSSLKVFRNEKRIDEGLAMSLSQVMVEQAVGKSRAVFGATAFFGQEALLTWYKLDAKSVNSLFFEVLDLYSYADKKERASRLRADIDRRYVALEARLDEMKRSLQAQEAVVATKQEAVVATKQEAIERASSGPGLSSLVASRDRIVESLGRGALLLKEAVTKAGTLRDEIKRLQAKIASSPAKICPTCGQEIRDTGGEDISQRWKMANEAAEAAELIRSKIQGLERQMWELDGKIGLEREREVAASGLVKRVEDELASAEDMLASSRARVAATKYHLSNLTERRGELDYLVRAYGDHGIPAMLIENITPELTRFAKYYSELLTSGDLLLEFDTDQKKWGGKTKEMFRVNASHHSTGKKYPMFSGGDRRRCNIVASMAFRAAVASATGRPSHLLVCDEMFEGLDEPGQEAVLDMLVTEAKDALVLVISHMAHLAGRMGSSITVTRSGGVSVVET